MTAHRVVHRHTSPPRRVDPEQALATALDAIAVGCAAGLGDLFDLVGAEVWRACVVGSGDPDLARDAVVATFREVWQRPEDVPSTLGEARRWVVGVAVRNGAELAAR